MSGGAAFVDECERLRTWLVEHAYPLWFGAGIDREHGGFHEKLALDGTATGDPRRARLHPRQIFAFAYAREIGWDGPSETAMRHGLDFFQRHYFRSDGLIRTCVDARGQPLDETAHLYDQAFGLVGFAAAFAALREERWLQAGRTLRDDIVSALGLPIGFDERLDHSPPLLANSHMHLLEACLAWRELDDKGWYDIASTIVELAIDRMLHSHTYAITELFDRDWRPLLDEHGRLVEPGHLFEWGWLLLRWAIAHRDTNVERHALRLIDTAEHGVHTQRQVAMNGLALFDGTLIVRDARARLWPQTERIKALTLAARITGDPRHIAGATRALVTLRQYLDVPIAGLWRDMMNTDGTFVVEPAPASSFYHLVGATLECLRYVRSRTSEGWRG